jgi:pyruvate,water dikinase
LLIATYIFIAGFLPVLKTASREEEVTFIRGAAHSQELAVDKQTAWILWFDQLGIEDVGLVGGKNASLGEMYRYLTPKGVPIPNGYAVTATAFRYFVEKSGVRKKVDAILADLNTKDIANLQAKGKACRQAMLAADFPAELSEQIKEGYRHLCLQYGEGTDVAVRSSATAEDLPDASFAGQQETYLNISGDAALLEACKKCFASLFTDRAISYRADKGFDQFQVALSIGVQKMVRSDLACSGVMFSIDTESGFSDAVFVTASYGLGENIVQGAVNPDEYYVFKPTLRQGFKPIVQKTVGEKKIKMVYANDVKRPTKNVDVSPADQKKFVLSDEEILALARYAVTIEDHYSQKAGHFKPMDMEWAKDGKTGQLFIVQARPETIHSREDKTKLRTYVLHEKGQVLAAGNSVGEKIGSGKANIIKDVHNINKFRAGEVLVTDMTDPDWEPIMKIASAIVTNRGGRTCHAAIISRELGIPCVVGCETATEAIPHGETITVDCSGGNKGFVYKGALKFTVDELDLQSIPRPKTHVMINVGNPDQAFDMSFLPNDGVGLCREEFIITSYIKVHPMALLQYGKLDAATKKQIDELTVNFAKREDFYVEKLAQGIGKICAAFWPKPVIVRMADFKTNEYRGLLGGQIFEPSEDNPMMGWRGASRYYDPNYMEGFRLECLAFKRVRDEMGLTNMELMIPMCRTLEEGRKVQAEMKKHGLERGKNGLKLNVMCEVPANVILADEFLNIFDGFSIGSNDLTQFTLAVDRDSQLVAHVYDERNDAVKLLVAHAIDVCNQRGKYIGICGQAPSDYPEFAEFLVECGIQSISLNPDTVIKTRIKIADKEKSLGR